MSQKRKQEEMSDYNYDAFLDEKGEREHSFAQCYECLYGSGERPCSCSKERKEFDREQELIIQERKKKKYYVN